MAFNLLAMASPTYKRWPLQPTSDGLSNLLAMPTYYRWPLQPTSDGLSNLLAMRWPLYANLLAMASPTY